MNRPNRPADGADAAPQRGTVRAWAHEFIVTEEASLSLCGGSNGLVCAMERGARIFTGVYGGPVTCSVQLLAEPARPPSAAEMKDWDDIVEISVLSTTGGLTLAAIEGEQPTGFPVLSFAGPGSYRLRVHVRGRDLDTDGVAEDAWEYDDGVAPEPTENYLLQVWPATPAPEVSYQLRDAYGAWRRGTYGK
jgi:hypothetical protein